MKGNLLFLFVMFIGVSSTAQQVVASSGNSFSTVSYSVDWTLGEPVIETFTGSNNMLTQGFHQTKLVVTSLQDLTFPGLEVKVFPNPTENFLRIEVLQQGNDVFRYELSEITGRKIWLKELKTQSDQIDMSSYASGIYLLHLFNSRDEHIKICKIIKN